MHKICMHHCEALNLLLLSYVIVHDQMHREVFDFLFKIWKSLWMFGWVFYPVVWNQQKEVDVRDCFMMLQPVSGWEIVTYWILFVGFSLVIIALSIESFFSQMNECHSEVLIPWVSVLVWYTQWVFRFFVTSRVCSPNTYSVGLIHTLNLASRASHICRKSKRAH